VITHEIRRPSNANCDLGLCSIGAEARKCRDLHTAMEESHWSAAGNPADLKKP
jgi:hypothetical protein